MLIQADALHIPLPDQSAHMVCFSPPYWGLRDYGIDGQIGLESSPYFYVADLVDVLRNCWRVLKPDGVCWVNIGDCHITQPPGNKDVSRSSGLHGGQISHAYRETLMEYSLSQRNDVRLQSGLPLGTLALVPFEFAIAARNTGWLVRQVVIWYKAATMPESVRKRPATRHEFVFMLTKSLDHYYAPDLAKQIGAYWNVWEIAPQPLRGHTASWPEELVNLMVQSSCPEGGLVLDPFVGSGTTVKVARELGRRAIGLDLSMEYLRLAQQRNAQMTLWEAMA